RRRGDAHAQLPLDRADPCGVQCGDLARGGTLHQEFVVGAPVERPSAARYVAGRVLENRESGTALKAQAVLFRASHHSAALEIELAMRGIPFVKFGGLKFLDSAHVKD